MDTPWVRCLILACGNTLRGDDGIGSFLCSWAEERFASESGVRAIACQQWTPDLAEDISRAESVLFIDCSLDQEPGQLLLREIKAADPAPVSTHYLGAAELLRLAQELYDAAPRRACLLTIGAGSIELSEQFSSDMQAVLPDAQALLELTVRQFLR
jgi:hydrogenase maturation protease